VPFGSLESMLLKQISMSKAHQTLSRTLTYLLRFRLQRRDAEVPGIFNGILTVHCNNVGSAHPAVRFLMCSRRPCHSQ
jgi:hypothetical protein